MQLDPTSAHQPKACKQNQNKKISPGGAVELLKMGKAPDVVVGVPNKLVPVPP
jgi:hypothetical protein